MRKAFSEILVKMADSDPRLVFLTGDLGFQVFDELVERIGPRYINAGVAEAQMIDCAAGLAAEGWHPVAYSIASFATGRPFEQIRYSVSYPNAGVTVVGAGRGLTYSTAGVSHHAVDDISLMAMLPNMTVVIPGDPTEIEQLYPQVVALGSPAYFTVGRFGEPRYEAEEAAVLGKARLVRKGERIAILSTGEAMNEVIEAVAALEKESIQPIVYQMHTVKPLDVVTLEKLAEEVEAFIVVDEHVPHGGLYSEIACWMAETRYSVPLVRLGLPDAFMLGNLKRENARRTMGYDAAAIEKTCRSLWRAHGKRVPRLKLQG
jgi:transketolase